MVLIYWQIRLYRLQTIHPLQLIQPKFHLAVQQIIQLHIQQVIHHTFHRLVRPTIFLRQLLLIIQQNIHQFHLFHRLDIQPLNRHFQSLSPISENNQLPRQLNIHQVHWIGLFLSVLLQFQFFAVFVYVPGVLIIIMQSAQIKRH